MIDSWKQYANCAGMDTSLFFLELGQTVSKETQAACGSCTVSVECLWYANETHSSHGIFGGMSPNQREDWRKRYKIALGQRRN